MSEKGKRWVKATLIRTIRTFFQSFASLITVGAMISELNWEYMISVSAVSAIYCIATALAGLPEVDIDGVQ